MIKMMRSGFLRYVLWAYVLSYDFFWRRSTSILKAWIGIPLEDRVVDFYILLLEASVYTMYCVEWIYKEEIWIDVYGCIPLARDRK